jgi:hypothetical protein
MALAAKAKAETFEGRFFDRVRAPKLTVSSARQSDPSCGRAY